MKRLVTVAILATVIGALAGYAARDLSMSQGLNGLVGLGITALAGSLVTMLAMRMSRPARKK